jgi:hypothetical protein
MRLININYPKESEDEEKLDRLVASYKKKCEPGVLKHMNDMSLLEFKPRTDNFSTPSFCVQLRLLMGRQKVYL